MRCTIFSPLFLSPSLYCFTTKVNVENSAPRKHWNIILIIAAACRWYILRVLRDTRESFQLRRSYMHATIFQREFYHGQKFVPLVYLSTYVQKIAFYLILFESSNRGFNSIESNSVVSFIYLYRINLLIKCFTTNYC